MAKAELGATKKKGDIPCRINLVENWIPLLLNYLQYQFYHFI